MMRGNPLGAPAAEFERQVLERLRTLRAENRGRLPRGVAPEAAEGLSYSGRHLRRLVRDGRKPRAKYEIDSDALQALLLYPRSRAAAYHHLETEGKRPRVGLSQFRRAYRDQNPETRAFIEGGLPKRKDKEPRLRIIRERPFEALYLDTWVIKAPCRPPDGHAHDGDSPDPPLIRASAINVVDPVTRAVVGKPVVVPGAYTHAHVWTALARALLPTLEWGPWHGTPDALHYDNDSAHLAEAITWLLVDLDLSPISSDPDHPWQNGAVEAFHLFAMNRILPLYPFSSDARRGYGQQVFMPPAELAPPFESVADTYVAAVREYNETWRIHDRGGKTALELWNETAEHPPAVPERLRRVLAQEPRYEDVYRGAITFDSRTYIHGALGGIGEQRVEVRNVTEDTIDVYDRFGSWICLAENERTASPDTREGVRLARAERRDADLEQQRALTRSQEAELRAEREAERLAAERDKAIADFMRSLSPRDRVGLNEPIDHGDRP